MQYRRRAALRRRGPGSTPLPQDPGWAKTAGKIDSARPRFWANATATLVKSNAGYGRGFRWADAAPIYTTINTLLPPNSECVSFNTTDSAWAVVPPSSRHQGGAHILMGDGAVRFITDNVEAGDQHAECRSHVSNPGQESPYGIWAAAGSRNGQENKAL